MTENDVLATLTADPVGVSQPKYHDFISNTPVPNTST